MTWEIALGIIALLTFIGSVGVYIGKLSKALGVLETTIKILNTTITEFKVSSRSTHESIFDRLAKGERKLENHEVRIDAIERNQRK